MEEDEITIEQQIIGELDSAKAANAKMQEGVRSTVDTLLAIKKYHEHLPPIAFRIALMFTLAHYTIEKQARPSKHILKTYDELMEQEWCINARSQALSYTLTNSKELEKLIGGKQTDEVFAQLKPTLDEIASTYYLISQTIVNYKRALVETWQLLYQNDFLRDVSRLYNGAAKIPT